MHELPLKPGETITIVNDFSGSFIFACSLAGFVVYPVFVNLKNYTCTCAYAHSDNYLTDSIKKWNNFCREYQLSAKPVMMPMMMYGLDNVLCGKNSIVCDETLKVTDFLLMKKSGRVAEDFIINPGEICFYTQSTMNPEKFNKDIYELNYSHLF